ncbi:MAG: hypothetical protein KGQ59_01640 [Bdellovibrionales bacterium]|nr:hypothetical protein [Bdellovibrionales bacterium]
MMQRPVLTRVFGILILGTLSIGGLLRPAGAQGEGLSSNSLTVVWKRFEDRAGQSQAVEQTLRAFNDSELRALPHKRLASSGGTISQGPLLSSVLETAMKDLSAEARSQIDLVVLHGEAGRHAWIPRALVTRSSLLLAMPDRNSVIPSGSHSRLQAEELPFSTYGLQRVQRVELTNYRERFGSFYLKRRTDPAAVRGEKVFIQNCMACHSQWGKIPSVETDSLVAQLRKHPRNSGYQGLSSKSEKALFSYWAAYRLEQGAQEAPSAIKNSEKR